MTRQDSIEQLEIGESIAEARRLDYTFGMSKDEVNTHLERLRGIIDSQVARARRKGDGRTYTVENIVGCASRSPAILISVIATRLS